MEIERVRDGVMIAFYIELKEVREYTPHGYLQKKYSMPRKRAEAKAPRQNCAWGSHRMPRKFWGLEWQGMR